jgi:SAM-dependent methyltransferase
MKDEREPQIDPPEGEPSSHAYWRAMSGYSYQQMIAERQSSGQAAYRQQEAFLAKLIAAEQQRLGRELQVLEFGCGFGRHAWWISELPGARYHGYDFSEEMVAPLRKLAPAALAPLAEHLFVGPDVASALGERRFDLIFTVSVLIHSPREQIPKLLAQMDSLLAPGGAICLVENRTIPFDVYDNNWHQGCWLHRYLDILEPGWDLHLAQRFVDTHDIYLLRRNGQSVKRIFRVASPENAFEQAFPLSEMEVDQSGLRHLEAWARRAEPLIRGAGARDEGLTEERELLRVEHERVGRRQKLLTLAEDLQEIRAGHSHVSPERDSGKKDSPSREANVLIDDPFDTHWAHQDARFHRVLHVFSQEWRGIRAAAGYLPGHKMAVTADRTLSDIDHRFALEAIAGAMCEVLVIHGWSKNIEEIVRLARRHQRGLRVTVVWHGSSAQFFLDFDFKAFDRLLQLRREGLLHALGVVKPGLQTLSPRIHPQLLLNIGPRLVEGRMSARGTYAAALVPVPNIALKNFYTNLYAAAGEARTRTVFVTTLHRESKELSVNAKVVLVEHPMRAQLFRLTTEVDVVLNASLSECQPMTALESLAHGVPCLTGPLTLGELTDHPYQQLVQVAQVDSVDQVRAAMVRILDEQARDPHALRVSMAGYLEQLTREALNRYVGFLAQ